MPEEARNVKSLAGELERLAEAGGEKGFDIELDAGALPGEERELARLFNRVLQGLRAANEHGLMKYRLASEALGIGHWDMDVVDGDPVDPNNAFTWLPELRHMLGFEDESDFPNVLRSWSGRLHPEDKDRVLAAFEAHLSDASGKTPYNLQYRMMNKGGEYRHMHAFGATVRDAAGRPLRVAGALKDITGKVQQQEMLENILDAMDSYIYVSDLETDEICFINKKMINDFAIRGEARGDKCWHRLQLGQKGRCPWCKKPELIENPDKIITWEETDPDSHDSLYNIDRVINWPDGRKVHMQQCIDISGTKQAQQALMGRENMLSNLNRAAIILLSRGEESIEDAMAEGIGVIAEAAKFGRMSVLRNTERADGLHASQIYRWVKSAGGTVKPLKELRDVAYADAIPHWEEALAVDEVINGPAHTLPGADVLARFGCMSLLAVPVYSAGRFWGFVLFEDLAEERRFNELETDMLRTASFMLAHVVMRNEEAKLVREADEHMKLMLEATPLSCLLWNAKRKIIDCNEAAVKLYGFPDKEELKKGFFGCQPEYQPDGQNSAEQVNRLVDEAFIEGYTKFDWMHKTLDGTLFPAEVTLVRVKYRDGYVVAGYTRDLREQKRMMREIERQGRLLQAVNHMSSIFLRSSAEDFGSGLLSAMGLMAQAAQADRVYLWKNSMKDGRRYCTQIYEYSENATPQQGKDYTLELPYADGLEEFEARLLQGQCVNGPVREMPLTEQALLLEQGIVSVLMVPIFLKGEFWGFLGFDDCHRERMFSQSEESILRSASELIADALLRNEMEENLRAQTSRLQDALAGAKAANYAKSEFLSRMSHEMRTPMNAVIGMTAIGRGEKDVEKKDYAFEKIDSASKHLLGVINDVLDMSKIEANKLELSSTDFVFEKMLQEVVDVINFRVEERRQSLYVEIDPRIPASLIGDDQRLAQVITNLLSNAVKFTPEEGSIHLRAGLVAREGEQYRLQISVTDNGIGLSNEQKERVFHSFEQAESATQRQYGGTGLGLAISKRIVEMMGGEIWADSEMGQGSTFAFTALFRRGAARHKRLLAPGVGWGNIRIFAVDDEPEVREFFVSMAKTLDITCEVAASGEEALEKLEAGGGYDIYFIDWQLPGMNGIELARRIHEKWAKDSLVLLFSSTDWSDIESAARAAGITRFLSKPLFQSDVVDVINECLGFEGAKERGEGAEQADDDFSGHTILLAEDVEINREIVLALLEGTGLGIDCAVNGKEALRMISEAPDKYELVFMDVQMPEMDGYEATRRIRALEAPRARQVPIVAMTANVFREDVERCLAAGMNSHVGKPVIVEEMMAVLREFLIK